VRNFYEQLEVGKGPVHAATSSEPALVLSDVHIGNIRITPNHKVALLDRHFFLKITRQDRLFLHHLNQTEKMEDRVRVFINYLLDLDENQELRQKHQGDRKEWIAKIIEDITSKLDEETLGGSISFITALLGKQGLKIPLRLRLLIKNIKNLEKMAQQVGFDSLDEAKNFRPPEPSALEKAFLRAA